MNTFEPRGTLKRAKLNQSTSNPELNNHTEPIEYKTVRAQGDRSLYLYMYIYISKQITSYTIGVLPDRALGRRDRSLIRSSSGASTESGRTGWKRKEAWRV